MSNNNNFSNFQPQKSTVVGIQEWTAFLNTLNRLLNILFNTTTKGTVVMTAGLATVTIQSVKQTSNVQAIMQIGGTQTGFLQATCSLNTVTIKSTVGTDAGTISYLVTF